MSMDETLYKDNGYLNRAHYLQCLADDNGVPLESVLALADLLGPSEDFDGLVTAIQDEGERLSGEL